MSYSNKGQATMQTDIKNCESLALELDLELHEKQGAKEEQQQLSYSQAIANAKQMS